MLNWGRGGSIVVKDLCLLFLLSEFESHRWLLDFSVLYLEKTKINANGAGVGRFRKLSGNEVFAP